MNVARLLETNLFFYRMMNNRGSVLGNRITGNRYADLIVQPAAGDYKWSARTLDFNGWMKCDGRSLEKAAYPDLYAVIGENFGSDEDYYFCLPDCQGRTPCAIGQGETRDGIELSNRSLGQYLGKETHTLIIDEMPIHDHDFNDPGHTHTVGDIPSGTQSIAAVGGGSSTAADEVRYTQTSGSSTTGITVNNNGNNQPHENMQPSVFLGSVFIYSGRLPAGVVVLDNIREWVTNEEASIAFSDAFPDSYAYIFDQSNFGQTGYTMGIRYMIDDGGNDMYDDGNFIWIEGDVFGENELPNASTGYGEGEGNFSAIPYGTLYNKPDLTGGVFVSSSNVYPHLVMTYTVSGTLKIRCFGDVGSDGDATVNNFEGTYTCDNGRTGQYWANINYLGGGNEEEEEGGNDPSIGDVWFTITKPEWGSDITDVDDQRKQEDNGDYNEYVAVTGVNYIFCKVLLSRQAGAEITADLVEKFLSNYVQSMPSNMGFNIDMQEED
jgi:microcystin-dependent protein